MAKISAKNAIILVGGYNLSTYYTSYEVQEGVNPADVTGFSDAVQNFIPTVFTAQISGSALWDGSSDTGSFWAHKGYLAATTDVHVTIFPEGAGDGYPSISLPSCTGGITPTGAPNSPITLGTINFVSMGDNEGVENGFCMYHGTVTASTTSADITVGDITGAVTARCSATLHVWTATTTDSYVVKVRHCATSDGVYADLVTFTMDGFTIGSERVEVASGTINQFKQVQATRTGAAANPFGFSVHYWQDPLATT